MIRCVRAPLVLVKRLRVRDVSFLRCCGVQERRRVEVRFFASWQRRRSRSFLRGWFSALATRTWLMPSRMTQQRPEAQTTKRPSELTLRCRGSRRPEAGLCGGVSARRERCCWRLQLKREVFVQPPKMGRWTKLVYRMVKRLGNNK